EGHRRQHHAVEGASEPEGRERIELGRGDDGDDSGGLLRGRHVDGSDAGARVRTAHEADVRDAVELNIIEKATGAAQQRRILAAPSGATDVAHDVSPDCTITGMHRAWPAFAVAVLIATVVASPAGAQVFFSAEPHAPVSIGPLFVAGTAARDAGPMTVNVTWNLVGPSGRRPTAQVLHLFWPAEIAAGTAPGDADAELLRYVDSRGFAPTISGRLLLRARDRSQLGLPTPADPV